MTPIVALDQQLKNVCPIEGVSIGLWNDKSTWQISFKSEATQSERTLAQSILLTFDPTKIIEVDRVALKAQLQAAPTLAALKAVLNELL